ncbi:MAG: TolC family protein [Gemmatimonadaceae bacterium]|nr:TolC family protein [Gemmatimonadaceae bacterium]
MNTHARLAAFIAQVAQVAQVTLVTLVTLVAPVVASAQNAAPAAPLAVVTLREARQRAARVDPLAVAARADVSTAAWERRAAVADLITPTLSATTNYTNYNEPFFSFTGTPSSTTSSASVSANYVVIGGGKLAERKRAAASLDAAEAGEVAASFRTAATVDGAYYLVLAESELSRVAADRLRRAREQLAVARVRVSAGETIATDSLQLLLEVNRARLDVARRDSALAVSRLRLGRMVGEASAVDAAPLDSAPPPELPLSLEAASAELRERGPELLAVRAAERQADAAVAAERSNYLPSVALSAGWQAYDATFFPSFLQRSAVGVTVTLPIWDAGRRELDVARSRGARDVARAQREERERASSEAMAQVWNGYRTARVALELAQVGVQASTETYRVQGARYREGATTILDLLEAQTALGEAEATLVQARFAARSSLAQIEALLGRRLFTDNNQARAER